MLLNKSNGNYINPYKFPVSWSVGISVSMKEATKTVRRSDLVLEISFFHLLRNSLQQNVE